MKNDEIRDRLATLKESVGLYKIAGRHTSANRLEEACGIIETLLARQDEVRAVFDRAYISSKSESASNAILSLYKEIRAILDPQEPDA